MKRKPKLYEDEPVIVTQDIGSYFGYTGEPFKETRKEQIGFIRAKEKRPKRTRKKK